MLHDTASSQPGAAAALGSTQASQHTPGGPSSSTQGVAAVAMVDPTVFVYDSRLWLRASSNRMLKEVWRECERHLKAALALHPAATMLSFALCHVYVVSGRFSAARDAARGAAAAAPHDTDAHALLHLMERARMEQALSSHGGGDGSGGGPLQGGTVGTHCGHACAAQLVRALRVHGHCDAALAGLLAVCGHCGACTMRAALGCLAYLDMAAGGVRMKLRARAWACLAACLCALAEEMLHQVAGDEGRGEEREDGSTAGGGVGVSGRGRGSGAAAAAVGMAQLCGDDEAWVDMQQHAGARPDAALDHGEDAGTCAYDDAEGESPAPSDAVGRWRTAVRAAAARAYWWERAQLSQTMLCCPGTAAAASGDTALPAHSCVCELAHRTAVSCFMLGPRHDRVLCAREAVGVAVQRQREQQLQPEQPSSASTAQQTNDTRQPGGPELAELEDAAQLLSQAVALVQQIETRRLEAAAAVAVGRSGTDPQSLPHARLPESWWKLFPHVRRRSMHGGSP